MKNYCITIVALICMAITGCKDNVETKETVPVKVKIEKVKLNPISGIQLFSGTIEEMSSSILSFSVGGTIKRLYVSPGQMVAQGMLLAEVDETSLRNAYDGTLAMRQQAEDAYMRMKMLHDNKSLPEIQWMEVQSKLKQAVATEQIAKKGMKDCKLYAPFSGYISEKMVEVGYNILPSVPVLKLVKIEQVKVKFSVPESEIAQMKNAMKMNVCVPAINNRSYEGSVIETGITAHPLSRSYDVKVLVNNHDKSLLPGMICRIYTKKDSGETAIMLPNHVVQIDEANRPFVWLNAEGRALKRIVQTGGITAQGIIIIDGVQPGDEVIVKGQQKISAGHKITTK